MLLKSAISVGTGVRGRWCQCTCGRFFPVRSEKVAADTVRRHEGRHVVTDNLVLAEGPPSLSNTLFLIVSHKAAEHNSRALKDHVASVVGSAHVHVVYGVPYGFEQVGRRLKYNEICAWVWIHKAFPRLHDLLQERDD